MINFYEGITRKVIFCFLKVISCTSFLILCNEKFGNLNNMLCNFNAMRNVMIFVHVCRAMRFEQTHPHSKELQTFRSKIMKKKNH